MPASTEQPASEGPLAVPDARRTVSRVMLILALLTLAGAFLLISPDPARTYPGIQPWSDLSILRDITRVMSLGGAVSSVRGTEIKDFALHLAAAAALMLLAVRAAVSGYRPLHTRKGRGMWFFGQVLLTGWVALSASSAWWSGDAGLSLAQAALYAFMLAWAIGLAWTIDRREIVPLLTGLLLVSALAAVLCIWYFYERNPFHRPGFPVGNPTTLAASIIPAILLALVTIAWQIQRWLPADGTKRVSIAPNSLPWQAIAAAVALVPLLWCFVLTSSRAAMIGLLVGLGVLVLVRVGRQMRWILGSVLFAAAILVGGWALWNAGIDAVMARGATVRFRLYTWQYAADLWARRPISGVGAAAFPRFSGQMAIRDKALDPAAFMGDWTAHVHNELFEVFGEIGMLGGVTFVGGFVATIIAALRLLRKPLSSRERWLYAGVLAGTAALMTDLMFSVGLRLPGVPAVFFTLIGISWAACRCAEAQPLTAAAASKSATPERLRRLLVATVAAACSIAAGWLALRNWSGVRHEFAAYTALREQRYDQAIASAALAQTKLLDPVRQLFAAEREVQARYGRARTALDAYREAASESGPATEAARRQAVAACRDTVDAAARLERRAPTFLRMPAIGANAAEMLVELNRGADPESAARWRLLARQAWRLQRVYSPFDEETLLALTRYPADLRERIGLLRDALRAETTSARWDETFERVAATPGFADALTQFQVATGPFDPQTDLNPLIASMAPEVHRLVAAYAAMNGAYLDAAGHSARAARLYEPMRGRFPMLQSAALAEQAQYVFRASPSSPSGAIDLIRAAIEVLPEIQEQQLAAKARPFQVRLTTYLLAGGDEQAAREQLAGLLDEQTDPSAVMADIYVNQLTTAFLAGPAASRPPVERWLDAAIRLEPRHFLAWSWKAWLAGEAGDADAINATLAAASSAGIPPNKMQIIRRDLCQQFPKLCEEIQPPPGP